MKRLTLAMLATVTALAVGLVCLPVKASGSEYEWRDGFYWRGGDAYSRTIHYNPVTYSRGYNGYLYAQPQTYYYRYTRVPVRTKYITLPAPKAPKLTPPPYTPGWKEAVLKVAKQRDDHAAYLEAVDRLGFTPPFDKPYQTRRYGTGATHDSSTYSKSYGASGATDYGYSLQQVKEAYGETNMNTLYSSAARLTERAQDLAGTAHTEHSELVSAAGDNAARIAEILAKGLTAERALRAITAGTRTTERTTITGGGTRRNGSGGTPSPPKMRRAPADDEGGGDDEGGEDEGDDELKENAAAFLKVTATPLCASCHGAGGSAVAKFDIGKYTSMTMKQKRKVWARLLHSDPKKRMPLAVGNLPGKPLTPGQFKAFLAH